MAHFAKLNSDHKVIQVVVVKNEVITDDKGKEQEQLGIDFLTSLFNHKYWLQTSYNDNFRGQFAGKGYRYDKSLDVFISPQPFPSWILDAKTGKWNAPKDMPEITETKVYKWNESKVDWDEISLT
tara:strand:- start:3638 stop:4012 length:375 start_codon:yes stop_codon:yes gene_type:complete